MKIKMTIRANWDEQSDDFTEFGQHVIEIDVPFGLNDQYKRIATIEVEDVENPPSLINRPSFNCRLSLSKKGMVDITY